MFQDIMIREIPAAEKVRLRNNWSTRGVRPSRGSDRLRRTPTTLVYLTLGIAPGMAKVLHHGCSDIKVLDPNIGAVTITIMTIMKTTTGSCGRGAGTLAPLSDRYPSWFKMV